MFKDLFNFGGGLFSSVFSTASSTILGNIVNPELLSFANTVSDKISALSNSITSKTNLKDINLQTSTYGRTIPIVFGTIRIAGNVMWASDITTTNTKYSNPLGKDALTSTTSTTTIRASFAIAVCMGEVEAITAIYVDSKQIDFGSNDSIVIYNGSETQQPSSEMQAHLRNVVPAFRGLCYVVFKNFPLENYGGRIPNFTFDVKARPNLNMPRRPENLVKAINIIPGSGEFVYDSAIQQSYSVKTVNGQTMQTSAKFFVNYHNNKNIANFVLATDQMLKTFPQLQWASLVVSWFCDSLEARDAKVYPACELKRMVTDPDAWSVGANNKNNPNTKEITKDVEGNPIYGGTVSDSAIIAGVRHLKSKGLSVCFYPMIFMDMATKPWRGKITSNSPDDVRNFFTKVGGYNEFINHYVNLVKKNNLAIDAFIIGSEMIGLTKVKTNDNRFPAVDELVKLAASVKSALGVGVKIIYAADWSEYHHTNGGWYNLDPLWASPNIDMIGIDAYFPLTDGAISTYSTDVIVNGWTSGEGYSFYYSDKERTNRVNLDSKYAWKNMRYFWANEHINPNGIKTAWVPKSKKIWLTEYGFPSVDCCTNQPNVFFAKDSEDGGLPRLSMGYIDFRAQKEAIYATEIFCSQNTDMIERQSLWSWDGRPYPFYPNFSSFWKDAYMWPYSHTVNGKLGTGNLADVVAYLCKAAGLSPDDFDVSDLAIDLYGYVIDSKQNIAYHIAMLGMIFGFDGYMQDGKLVFKMLSNVRSYNIVLDDILLDSNQQVLFQQNNNTNYVNTVDKIEIFYIDRGKNYTIGNVYEQDPNFSGNNPVTNTYKVNIALTQQEAKAIARRLFMQSKLNANQYTLALPIFFIYLKPLDVLTLTYNQQNIAIRISDIKINSDSQIIVSGVGEDSAIYRAAQNKNYEIINNLSAPSNTALQPYVLDLYGVEEYSSETTPALYLATAVASADWGGCGVYLSFDRGVNYNLATTTSTISVVGDAIITQVGSIDSRFTDWNSSILVSIYSGESAIINSATEVEWRSYVNLALIGSEVVAFKEVVRNSDGTMTLSKLLRGRFGTQQSVNSHNGLEKFILLKYNLLTKIYLPFTAIGNEISVKIINSNSSVESANVITYTPRGKNISSWPVDEVKISTIKTTGDRLLFWRPRSSVEYSFYNNGPSAKYAYYLQIKHKNTGNLITSKLVINSPQYLYTSAEAAKDGIIWANVTAAVIPAVIPSSVI